MQLETRRLAHPPAKLLEEAYDCIWVNLRSCRTLDDELTQWIDWQLGSAISRLLAKSLSPGATWISTMGRLPVKFVVLYSGEKVDPGAVTRSCEGMRIKKVLWLGRAHPKFSATNAYPEIVHTIEGTDS